MSIFAAQSDRAGLGQKFGNTRQVSKSPLNEYMDAMKERGERRGQKSKLSYADGKQINLIEGERLVVLIDWADGLRNRNRSEHLPQRNSLEARYMKNRRLPKPQDRKTCSPS